MNLLKILLIVFIAELPCMLRTAALQVRNQGGMWDVIWGTIMGSALALLGGIAIARIFQFELITQFNPYLNWAAGLILTGLGIFMMMGWND